MNLLVILPVLIIISSFSLGQNNLLLGGSLSSGVTFSSIERTNANGTASARGKGFTLPTGLQGSYFLTDRFIVRAHFLRIFRQIELEYGTKNQIQIFTTKKVLWDNTASLKIDLSYRIPLFASKQISVFLSSGYMYNFRNAKAECLYDSKMFGLDTSTAESFFAYLDYNTPSYSSFLQEIGLMKDLKNSIFGFSIIYNISTSDIMESTTAYWKGAILVPANPPLQNNPCFPSTSLVPVESYHAASKGSFLAFSVSYIIRLGKEEEQ